MTLDYKNARRVRAFFVFGEVNFDLRSQAFPRTRLPTNFPVPGRMERL